MLHGKTKIAGFQPKLYKTLQKMASKTTSYTHEINGFRVVQGELDKLRAVLEPSQEWLDDLPPAVRHMAQLCFDQVDDLSRRIAEMDAQIAAASRRSRFSARVQKMPGIGPNPLCQGSCPLLYFYSISQVGGIGR
jgi:transposase